MATLPYITAPGNIERALRAIKSAATPPSVSQDFVKTILKIPGGSGNQMTAYLRKIGFVAPDGSPSDLYRAFRNSATSGAAAAKALKVGYAPLYSRNEYMHQLADQELRGLVVEETGAGADSNVAGLIVASILALKRFANWQDGTLGSDVKQARSLTKHQEHNEHRAESETGHNRSAAGKVGLNLSYTINLNLPATSDVSVFNAIFKSLKENLLQEGGADE